MSAVCPNISPEVCVMALRFTGRPPVCNYADCKHCTFERRRRIADLPEPRVDDDRLPSEEEHDRPMATWDDACLSG